MDRSSNLYGVSLLGVSSSLSHKPIERTNTLRKELVSPLVERLEWWKKQQAGLANTYIPKYQVNIPLSRSNYCLGSKYSLSVL